MAFLFSAFVNLLMLTGPLYMLQVYDRVLGSQSEETLLALTLLMAVLFGAMGLLDFARQRILTIVGARFQRRLDRRVFDATLRRASFLPGDPLAAAAQRDLEAIQRLYGSGIVPAVFDMPWTPLFAVAIFVFHPWLGWLGVAGAATLVAGTVLNQITTRGDHAGAVMATLRSDRMSDEMRDEAETLRALGMTGAAFTRWQALRDAALGAAVRLGARQARFATFTRTFRIFLQSAMLGLGALVVLRGEMTAGAMIAASILLGRALAPVETAVSQWPVLQRAVEGWGRLSDLLSRVPPEPARTALPRPRASLVVDGLTVVPPGETTPALRMVGFRLDPGQALGIIGPSGSGKTTLARALTGVWRPLGGSIRLDGATLDQYDPDVLGGYFGYLPQRVTLFEGTIAQNIARLSATPDATAIVRAARQAAAHEMILRLPEGYDTRVGSAGGRLSGGQIQRIGLARALYGDPVILVLDEPDASLDNDGSVALNQAILALKQEGKAVLVIAHRPAAIQGCDLLMVIENGMRRAFGPRDQVLREMVRNHTDIVKASGPTGLT